MPADLILRGAIVHTVDAARRTAAAVAIENGRIAAVGDDREVDALRGPATRVVDLEGAMVLPGFQDAHCHLGESGHATTLCSLEGSRDDDQWRELLPRTPLQPHARHAFEEELGDIGDVTHVRFNIFPDGGVGRLRLFGRPR